MNSRTIYVELKLRFAVANRTALSPYIPPVNKVGLTGFSYKAIAYRCIPGQSAVIVDIIQLDRPAIHKGRKKQTAGIERLQIILDKEELDKIYALAETNAGENKSLLIRKLINAAFANPEAFGLYPPNREPK